MEEKLGIPISPLCDRRTVKKSDSQIGFLKFVIRPTYLILGEIIPKVQEEVMPLIEKNIKYWTTEKLRLSMAVMSAGAKLSRNLTRARKSIKISEEAEERDIANSADTNRSDDDDDDDDSNDDAMVSVAADAAVAVENNADESIIPEE